MIDKKIILIVGDEVQKHNPELFDDFKSYEYKEFFIDEFGSKQTMDYWSGDDFFGNYMEIFYFFGIDNDEDCSKCNGLKIWFKEYLKFDDNDREMWMKIAENSGYPKQVKIDISFGKVADFEYEELKDY